MHTRIIPDEEVLALTSRDESHFFDRKAAPISGKKVQKIGVAFANADGGEFVIGIADDKEEPKPIKRWQGVEKLEDLNGHLQALFEITPNLDLRYPLRQSRRQRNTQKKFKAYRIDRGTDNFNPEQSPAKAGKE